MQHDSLHGLTKQNGRKRTKNKARRSLNDHTKASERWKEWEENNNASAQTVAVFQFWGTGQLGSLPPAVAKAHL